MRRLQRRKPNLGDTSWLMNGCRYRFVVSLCSVLVNLCCFLSCVPDIKWLDRGQKLFISSVDTPVTQLLLSKAGKNLPKCSKKYDNDLLKPHSTMLLVSWLSQVSTSSGLSYFGAHRPHFFMSCY